MKPIERLTGIIHILHFHRGLTIYDGQGSHTYTHRRKHKRFFIFRRISEHNKAHYRWYQSNGQHQRSIVIDSPVTAGQWKPRSTRSHSRHTLTSRTEAEISFDLGDERYGYFLCNKTLTAIGRKPAIFTGKKMTDCYRSLYSGTERGGTDSPFPISPRLCSVKRHANTTVNR